MASLHPLECGLAAFPGAGASANGQSSPAKGHKERHVEFEPGKVEVQERKTKFLTAKYGTHQMNLIKKRLSVEMWMYDELQFLYDTDSENLDRHKTHLSKFWKPDDIYAIELEHRALIKDDCEVELDLDEFLDIEGGDTGKRNWLQQKLVNAKRSPEEVKKFIEELMKRAKTL